MNKVVVSSESHDSPDKPGDLYVINGHGTYIRAICSGGLRLVSLTTGNRWSDSPKIPHDARKVPKGSTVTIEVTRRKDSGPQAKGTDGAQHQGARLMSTHLVVAHIEDYDGDQWEAITYDVDKFLFTAEEAKAFIANMTEQFPHIKYTALPLAACGDAAAQRKALA